MNSRLIGPLVNEKNQTPVIYCSFNAKPFKKDKGPKVNQNSCPQCVLLHRNPLVFLSCEKLNLTEESYDLNNQCCNNKTTALDQVFKLNKIINVN